MARWGMCICCKYLLESIIHFGEVSILVKVCRHDLGEQGAEHIGKAEKDDATQKAGDNHVCTVDSMAIMSPTSETSNKDR